MNAVQVVFLVILAPWIHGFVQKAKAFLQGRRGPSVWQPYRHLRKLWIKDAVLSSSSSWITRAAPYIVAGFALCASATIPVSTLAVHPLLAGGSLFVFLYLLAAIRFSFVLVGMDSGSAFAGMGASRDLLFSVLAEPAAFLALSALAIAQGRFTLTAVAETSLRQRTGFATPVDALAIASLLMILLAETGRLPVDNPDTHLELTMVHEGMLLELTGRHLALATWSGYVRQLLWYTLWIDAAFPGGIATSSGAVPFLSGTALWIAKCLALGSVVAVIESLSAKARLFQIPRYLAFALALAAIALLADTVL